MNLNDTEIFADELYQKVDLLISERNFLRDEIERVVEIQYERDKVSLRFFHENVINNEISSENNIRLSHFLMIK